MRANRVLSLIPSFAWINCSNSSSGSLMEEPRNLASRLSGSLARLLLIQTVSLPEYTMHISLYPRVVLGLGEPFERPAAIFAIQLNSTEMPLKFSCDNGRCATPKKRGKHQGIPRRTCEDEFCHQLLRLLGRMVGVFGHGPERDGDVRPEVRRIRKSVVPVLRFLPVFGRPILTAVWSNDTPLEFDRVRVEVVVIAKSAEPYVFGIVLPVGLGTTSFFPLPGDPVSNVQM